MDPFTVLFASSLIFELQLYLAVNAKDASHVAKPRDNESDDDNEVDLDPHSVDIDE